MTALTSLGLFIFAVICYAIKELQAQNKLKWQDEAKDFFSFWGRNSWVRKYDGDHKGAAVFKNIINRNWYYRFFKIKYKERFPGSATIFVMFTDGFHLMQFLFKLFLVGSLVSYKEMVNPWVDMLIYLSIWGICFTIVYKELSK